MNFLSVFYAFFLIAIVGLYWIGFQSRQWRMGVLLLASFIFYASMQLQAVPLLLLGAIVTFRLGLELGENTARKPYKNPRGIAPRLRRRKEQMWQRRRTFFLVVGIVWNVVLLLGFKYLPFFLPSWDILMPFEVVRNATDWVLPYFIAPLGLSFFSFECIAYLIDIYRGAPACPRFLEFATYKFFFAKLIAGPITRYHHWQEQFMTQQFLRVDRVTEGLWLIASGAIKKGLLADRLAIFVNLCFDNLQRAGSGDLWLATLAYGLQLYFDFSGYVDIARGSAMLLGLRLPQNFDFPYLTTSIADFWRRWHMTLGDWLRNYLYFPLGGSRQGLSRTCTNLIIVMLIAGIWHGGAATRPDPMGYLVWGGLHGLALVAHRLTDVVSNRVALLKWWWQSLPGTIVGWGLTQGMVFISWIFFRLPDLTQSGWVVTHLWGYEADIQFAQKVYLETLGFDRLELAVLLWGLVALMGVAYLFHRGLKLQLNWPIKVMLVPICLYAVWLLAPQDSLPYIYFDF